MTADIPKRMIERLLPCLIILSLPWLANGCKELEDNNYQGEGAVMFSLGIDASVIMPVTYSDDSSAETPQPEEFAVEILNTEGKVLQSWNSFSEVPSLIRMQTGRYTLRAWRGEPVPGAFDSPYYEGTTEFSVFRNKSNPVSVTCRLANVMADVDYKEGFRHYFKDYRVEMRTTGDTPLVFGKGVNEGKTAYFEPGELTTVVTMTKQDGSETSFPLTARKVYAQEYYHFVFDIGEGAGGALLRVSFDEATRENPIEIDLDQDWITPAAPFLTPITGFEPGEKITLFEGEKRNISLLITARNGIRSCVIRTVSPVLQAMGWPETVDLVEIDDNLKFFLEGLGLHWTNELSALNMAILDLTELTAHLLCDGTATAEHLFEITVTDRAERSGEPVLVDFRIEKPLFNFLNTEPVFLNASEAYLNLSMPAGDISGVKVTRQNEWGIWEECPYTVADQRDEVYRLKVTAPASSAEGRLFSNRPVKFRASDNYQGLERKTETVVNVKLSNFVIHDPAEADVWADYLFLNVDFQEGANAEEIKIQRYDAAGEWAEATQEIVSRNDVSATYKISGLSPDTEYAFRAIYGEEGQTTGQTSSRRTETLSQLPNAGFEEWTVGMEPRTISKGGRYRERKFIGYGDWIQEEAAMTWRYPAGSWATVNAKTVPEKAGNQNTWYMAPSTLSSSAAYSGSSAALLRNVRWDNAGAGIGDFTGGWMASVSLSDANMPSSISQRSAGKLFLRTYAVTHSGSGVSTEIYNEGYPFLSRPKKLTGYYKYVKVAGEDAPYARIRLENRSSAGTVTIVEGTASFDNLDGAAGGYVPFEVVLDYRRTDLKPTHICVLFASSDKQDAVQSTETNNAPPTADMKSEAVSRGSEFYIDDLTLEY